MIRIRTQKELDKEVKILKTNSTALFHYDDDIEKKKSFSFSISTVSELKELLEQLNFRAN